LTGCLIYKAVKHFTDNNAGQSWCQFVGQSERLGNFSIG